MKKTILILTFVLILLSSFVLGDAYPISNPYDAVYVWQQNDTMPAISYDDVSNFGLATTGGTISVTGVHANATNYTVDNYHWNNTITFNSVYWTTSTIAFWYNPIGLGDNNVGFQLWQSVTNRMILMTSNPNRNFRIFSTFGGTACDTTGTNIPVIGTWYHVVFELNGSHQTLYIDGVSHASVACTKTFADFSDNPSLYIGTWNNGIYGQNQGAYDEVLFFNKTLTASEIWNIYNGNVTVPPPSQGKPIVTLISPINDTITNKNTVNMTCNASWVDGYLINLSLYINGTLNATNTTTVTNNSNYTFTNIDFGEGVYYWNCYACDNNSNCSWATNNFTYTIDFVDPVIVTNFINKSIYYQNNITGQFNFSDNTILNTYNISVDETQVAGQTGINNNFAQYNLSLDPSSYSVGSHTLTIRVADGHTTEELKGDYKIRNGIFNDYLEYGFWDNGFIRTQSKNRSIIDKWTSKKEIDRYTQIYEPAKPSSIQTFIEESDMPIYIINKPGYYGDTWIVMGDHWKDYVLEDEPGAKVSIKRINDYKVEVTIEGIKNHPERLVLKSVGDLNVVIKNYIFYILNSSISYSSDIIFETDQQTITLEINKTVSTNANLYWNGNLISSTKTNYTNYDLYTATFTTPQISAAQENITFYWNYTLTGINNTETGSITNNQTIYRISIDNCSTYTTYTINFSLLDETTINSTIGTIHATLHTYRPNSSNYRSNSFDFTGQNNYSICIYPSWATYNTTSYSFEYLATGYTSKEYMFAALEISNQSQEIKLYLTNSTLASNVVITLRDTNDNLLEDYTIRVKRYYPGTGEEITVEITQTDYNGNAVVHLILNDVYYSFSIEKDSQVIKSIPPAKYYTTAQTFIIDITDIELSFEEKVYYTVSPDSPVQSQPTNFSLTAISPGNYIEWFAIYTIFNNTVYLDNSTTSDGGTATIELNLTNQTGWLSITYYIKAQDESLFTFRGGYLITDLVPGEYSIETQASAWEDIFNVMWRVVVAVFASIIMVLVFVQFIGPEAAGIVGVLVQIGFLIKGWIPVWMGIVEAVIIFGLYLMYQRGGA